MGSPAPARPFNPPLGSKDNLGYYVQMNSGGCPMAKLARRILYAASQLREAAVSLAFLLLLTGPAAAQSGLPDGGVARAPGAGAVTAWYGQPTTRYGHGVLGDAIEAGSLVAVDEAGRSHAVVLPESQVFEDITPRLADLDGDGRNEVVTIRSTVSSGASVAVYGIAGARLTELASTRPIGRPNRWLSIAAIADFVGDGTMQLAVVKTPHIGGVLEILAMRGGELVSLYPKQTGYSTHFIGSRDVSLALAGDLDGDGAVELALPDATRRRLVVLRFGKTVETVSVVDLPARIDQPIQRDGARGLAVRLDNGETIRIQMPR